MGRYYTSGSGNFDGKFWFGVQPSDDPETVYGMREVGSDDSSYSDYESSDKAKVRRRLNKQFDILGVPKEKRVYKFNDGNEIGCFVWDELREYYMTKDRNKSERPDDRWSFETIYYPITREKLLAASRVELGLNILNEMRCNEDGKAWINAEW